MIKLRNFLSNLNPASQIRESRARGDTIVEVIIVTAVLALVLAASYSLTTHALQNGIDANKRTEALAIAQRQIEYIKDAYNHSTGYLITYQSSDDFCINPDVGASGLQPILFNPPNSACRNYNSSAISIDVSYQQSNQIFTATATWDAGSGGQDQLQLYYQTPS